MSFAAAWRWIWSQAWLVLGYMTFVAGANGAAARIATNQVSPLCLVFLRWLIVCATLTVLLNGAERRELRQLLRRHWRRLAWMSMLGYAGFNTLFYIAAYHTSAVNLTLLQSAIPVFVLAASALVLRTRVHALQVIGMAITFCGVVLVATKGDLARLAQLRIGLGDGLVLVACLFYACYAIGLRVRPSSTPLVFFAGLAAYSLLFSIPLAGAEILSGHAFWPSGKGWLTALFIAFGPSFTGQLCFMRGVDLIGAARAGLYANLIPVFGALCAVVVLHEAFTLTHAVALVLGLGGISLAERGALVRRGASARPGIKPPGRSAGTADGQPAPQLDALSPHSYLDREQGGHLRR